MTRVAGAVPSYRMEIGFINSAIDELMERRRVLEELIAEAEAEEQREPEPAQPNRVDDLVAAAREEWARLQEAEAAA